MEGAVLTRPEELAAASEEALLSNLPCIGCGYDLKSMRVSAKCPECGRACEESLGSMYAADAGDVSGMVVGLRMMMWAAIAFPALGGALLYLDIRRDTTGPEFALVGLAGAGIIGPILAAIGVRRVTTIVRPSGGAARWRAVSILSGAPRVRVMAAAYAACSTVLASCMIGLMLADRSGRAPSEGWLWVLGTLGVLTGVSWAVRNAVFCTYGARIAALSNRPGLRRVFGVMVWISLLGAGVALAYGLIGVLAYVFKSDLLYGYTSGRRSSVATMVMLGVPLVVSMVNLCGLAWLGLWPVMLGILAKHLQGVGLAMTGAGGVVLGKAAVDVDELIAGTERMGDTA